MDDLDNKMPSETEYLKGMEGHFYYLQTCEMEITKATLTYALLSYVHLSILSCRFTLEGFSSRIRKDISGQSQERDCQW